MESSVASRQSEGARLALLRYRETNLTTRQLFLLTKKRKRRRRSNPNPNLLQNQKRTLKFLLPFLLSNINQQQMSKLPQLKPLPPGKRRQAHVHMTLVLR
jgi:hypothetical protein